MLESKRSIRKLSRNECDWSRELMEQEYRWLIDIRLDCNTKPQIDIINQFLDKMKEEERAERQRWFLKPLE